MRQLFLYAIIPLLLFSPNNDKYNPVQPDRPGGTSKWTGTLVLDQKYEGITGTSERHVKVSFVNALPTLHRDDDIVDLNFTDDKGTGNVTYHAEAYIGGKKIGYTDCSGGGKSELHEVVVDEEDNNYRIHAMGPGCIGTTVYEGKAEEYGPEITDIIVSDEPLGNKNMLAGTRTTVVDLGGDLGTVTTTITWSLSRETTDAELIVTPENYHDWMPEPGINEMIKGNTIRIDLKVHGPNGQPLRSRVRSFELRLSNTSKEPGIVLNAPVTPLTTFPDLRFLPQSNAAVSDEFQKADIGCLDGSSGSILIGSFDGGGYTTLTAVAILQDNSRLEGHLLISGGNTEIPIPKRAANSNIALKWWNANNNPADDYDDETSAGNKNNGDGLTAYEEYRGVISRGKHKRLDPAEKEVGVWMKPGEVFLYREGIRWLENSTGMKVIQFSDNEIGPDRRLNKNFQTAHTYDQYALKLTRRNLRSGVLGRVSPTPGIPQTVQNVFIDLTQISQRYDQEELEARSLNVAVLFTHEELIAKTISHELGHAMNIQHHGNHIIGSANVWVQQGVPVRIFHPYGTPEENTRPYHLLGSYSDKGGQASGDIFCIMNYNPLCNYSYKRLPDTEVFIMVPRIPLGQIMCNDKTGTQINATVYYFGDAENGNCLSQIKLK
ncbi:MAG: hypothetical protein HOP10_11355 [Chitinophagaceae bacterium]|nr:hypothetical protein [Chitinophagaceae bacterium]